MLKWNGAGHIMQTNENKWTKRLIEWTPHDQKQNQENQTLSGVMNYLNLTPIGLKRALIVKNGGNRERLFSCSGANTLLLMMMMMMCNDWREPNSPSFRRNVAAVASLWQHCVRFDRL